MSSGKTVKPTDKAIKTYYKALQAYARQDVEHETALRSAFQTLLEQTGRQFGWTLIPELAGAAAGKAIRPDGTFRDDYYITRGHWEAKDTHDKLETEVRKKLALGYPAMNIIFEDTRQGLLYQNGGQAMKADLADPQQLCDLLNAYFAHTEPAHEDFGKAIDEFRQRVPDLALGLVEKIKAAHRENPKFIAAFDAFYELCRNSLNPNLSVAAVDEMLVQHLLTERLIRTIFDNQDFTRRNVIAAEVEKVIDALVSKSFNRHDFLKSLDRFYLAIEQAAATIESFTEKQHFLNTVYERFFQGYSVKVADTHGIVYTPQEIVDFMCASVEELLASEFGKTLGDKGVHILDPCTGTGNFVVNLLRRIPKRDLARIYRHQLFANEVMLLPYYIAALNIEHAYYELTGEYEAFPGLCFVDTLELAKGKQATFGFMTEENVERVARQTEAPITVVIGNPPYNAWQLNENDNNKNRKYELIDRRVSETYAKDSTATNKNALADMYIKFFRWAVDRLNGRDGIVTFVSNNGFLQGLSADGFRKHLVQDFQRVYHFDFKGNARTSGERRRREGGNIFSDQIRVGVGITVLVRCRKRRGRQVRHHAVGDYWPADRKKTYLASMRTLSCVPWTSLRPSETGDWFAPETASEFSAFPALATKDAKAGRDQRAIFCQFSGGVKTNRDVVVYDFDPGELKTRVEAFLEDYNAEVDRYRRVGGRARMDEFVHYEKVKWSESLKANVRRGIYGTFDASSIRHCLYRPFAVRALYFDELLNERRYQLPQVFPTRDAERENTMIALTTLASEKPFMVLVAKILADIHLVGAGSATQCFPFYIYDQDGTNRRENITDWALAHFRNHYGNKRLTKWDIFHYVYAVLHHPGYRQRYAENLKRELPRIPLAADFRAFATAGEKLARLHLDYEKLDPWPLDWQETPGVPLSYRVEKMRLAKDKRSLAVNASLTLGSIPPEVFEYRLGNRSALEWVIDQCQVSEDQRSGVRSDPNRADDPQYIVRLVGQVVRASVETVAIVETFERTVAAAGLGLE